MFPSLQLLPPVAAKRSRAKGCQYFVDERGTRLPSVTSILNATKPWEDRQALARWRQRVGSEAAKQISGKASRRGTLTHKHIKQYLLGEAADCPEAARPYWESVQPVLREIDAVRLVESTVFHYDLGYAGQVDCVVNYQGVPCILDWKTSDRPKESVERLRDQPLQLAAYCGAVNHTYSDHDLQLRSAMLVVALPDQPAEIFWFTPQAMGDYWQRWQTRLDEFRRREARQAATSRD